MPNILAFAESRGGDIRRVAFEAITAARALASGGEVHAVLCGPPGIAAKAAELAKYGASVVHVAEHAAFANYAPESIAAAVAQLVSASSIRAAVFAASAQGKDLAPRVAAKLRVPIATDVIRAQWEGETLVADKPGYTGKVIATLALTATPALISVRPGAFVAAESPAAGRAETLALPLDPANARVKVTQTIAGDNAKLDLGEARVIVAGGRGLKEAKNFELLETLAAAFGNAAVGATRAVTDDGWRPHSDQIGQTGRLVSPDLYIAVGISGAIQHLAGMRTSRTIVAINRDKEAPIFKVADYGIVGDSLEVVPALTSAVREARKGA
ncbi:MAG TPA: electron transfer flavoprotein subunit alpha/FixB family protein [Gemmatimonadaceae bacterium]|nr:electron transfer flavoprotein subunit alpha/FixB family protein [Gemmatimonadaceae bacterium]